MTESIVTRGFDGIHGSWEGFIQQATEMAASKKLTIGILETLMVDVVAKMIEAVKDAGGDILSSQESEAGVHHCSKCGRKMIVSKKSSKLEVLTLLGDMAVYRPYVHCRPCSEGYGLGDAEKGIDGDHRMTGSVMEMITYVGQLVPSFERAEEAIRKLNVFTKLSVSHKTVQLVAEETGRAVHETDMAAAEEAYNRQDIAITEMADEDKEDSTIYLSMDGTTVHIRGENRFREIKLGLAFRDKDVMRAGRDSVRIRKKNYVTYLGSVNEFKKLFLTLALEAGYGRVKRIAILGDGAEWIWNMARELFPDATVEILDFYHLSENVHGFAGFLYPDDEGMRLGWAKTIIDAVWDGHVDDAIDSVKERMPEGRLPEGIVNLAHYMTNNRERIRYKEFREQGYYIGSGCIESGHKVVIHQRLKQAGMRWSLEGAQYMAALRAKHESDRWDDVVRQIPA